MVARISQKSRRFFLSSCMRFAEKRTPFKVKSEGAVTEFTLPSPLSPPMLDSGKLYEKGTSLHPLALDWRERPMGPPSPLSPESRGDHSLFPPKRCWRRTIRLECDTATVVCFAFSLPLFRKAPFYEVELSPSLFPRRNARGQSCCSGRPIPRLYILLGSIYSYLYPFRQTSGMFFSAIAPPSP